MKQNKNVKVVLAAFEAVERQDDEQFKALLDPEFEIHWPASLPYGEETAGPNSSRPSWSEIWAPLQPTAAERKKDPRVIAANDDEGVVYWGQRGVTSSGDRFYCEMRWVYYSPH